MHDDIAIVSDTGLFDAEVEALYARAFGPGRFAKAAARLREGESYQKNLSFLAHCKGQIVGACRLWPVKASNGVEALFLGPIAVDIKSRSTGLGQKLIETCLMQVDQLNDKNGVSFVVILVGDHAYFGRMGFEIIPTGQVLMPGPVDPKRLLWRILHTLSEKLPQGMLASA